MAKRSNEHPTVLVRKTLSGWEYVDSFGMEQCQHYALGAVCEMQITQRRSPRHHRLYWAVLAICVANSENKYGSSVDLHSAIKVACGYVHRVKLLIPSEHAILATKLRAILRDCWKYIKAVGAATALPLLQAIEAGNEALTKLETDQASLLLPGSIAFSQMDQAEFRVFFDRAMEQLRLAGYPVDEALEEAQKQLHRIKTVRSQQQPSLPQQRATEHVREQEKAA